MEWPTEDICATWRFVDDSMSYSEYNVDIKEVLIGKPVVVLVG